MESNLQAPRSPAEQREMGLHSLASSRNCLASPSQIKKRANVVRKEKHVACKPCRQAKLRCDGTKSGPCSRCRRLGQECHVDTLFKRVNKGSRFEELEKQLEQLRASITPATQAQPASLKVTDGSARLGDLLCQDSEAGDPFATPTSVQPYENGVSSIGPLEEVSAIPLMTWEPPADGRREKLPPGPAFPYVFTPASSDRSLGLITIHPKQIDELFPIFFEHYHPYVQLLDAILSPDECYVRCPALFWAIISVASRRYTNEPGLLANLSSPVLQLLWSITSASAHSCHTIQAILIISMWPFPTSSMWADVSYMLVTVAQTAASQLGLHRPEAIQDFSRIKWRLSPSGIQEAVRTWSLCYIAAKSISLAIGQQPSIPFDWTIDRVCDKSTSYMIPENLRHQVMIYRFATRVSTTMSGNQNSPTGLPAPGEGTSLLALLEKEHSDLCRAMEEEKVSSVNRILLDGVGIELQLFYFHEICTPEIRRKGLLRAYNTSQALIVKIQEADKVKNLMSYSPNAFYRFTTLSAIVMLKIINSSFSNFVDTESGKTTFNSALSLIRQSSVEDNDLPGRASKILAQLWSFQSQRFRKIEDPSIRLTTRSSASVLHDSLWLWRERFGGQSNGKNTFTGETSTRMWNSHDPQAAHEASSLESSMNMDCMFDIGMPAIVSWEFERNLGHFPSL